MKQRFAAVIILVFSFTHFIAAQENNLAEQPAAKTAPYQILLETDYAELTGCDVYHSYEDSLVIALDFLVFDEGSDKDALGYVQRETVHLFEHLVKSGETDLVDAACLPMSLRRLGEELGLLSELSSTVPDFAYPLSFRYDGGSTGFPDEAGKTYSVQSRANYIETTECLVSASTYEKLQKAFIEFFYYSGHPGDSKKYMLAFLTDVRDSRPTAEGELNPMCMTPGITKLAQDIGVLTEGGKIIP